VREQACAVVSLLLLCLGLLLVFEVLRPFRDLNRDGPLALASWTVGVMVAVMALWRGRGSRALNATAIALNLVVLLAVGAMLLLLSRSNFAFH